MYLFCLYEKHTPYIVETEGTNFTKKFEDFK